MCRAFEETREEGRAEGRAEGRMEGRAEGENMLASLITSLLADGRTNDIARVTADPEYRKQLYKEFQLA